MGGEERGERDPQAVLSEVDENGKKKPVSILNNWPTGKSSVRKEQDYRPVYYNNGSQQRTQESDDEPENPRPSELREESSSGSIPKYTSFNKYKNPHSQNNSSQRLKILTDTPTESSPQKSSSACSNTAVSFTVSEDARIPHHRYSISAKPGRASGANSPNPSSEHLNEKVESEEKNSIVHMPGDFIYFEPRSKLNPPAATGSPETPTPRKEVIKPSTGPQVPFTEFFQKQDDKKFHILIGATGSVATIKVPLIIDKLFKIYSREKVSIQLIVTKPAEHFLRGLKISTDIKIWREEDEWSGFKKMGDPVLHHELRKWADIFLIAPLSANSLAKLANGICDNLLTSVMRDWSPSTPVLVAPAMNTFMYINPMTKTHLKILQEDAPFITVLKPVEKVLICGDIGMGGMREWNDIVEILRRKITELLKTSSDDEDEDEEEEDEEEEDEEEEEENQGHTKNQKEGDDEDDYDDDEDDDEEDDDEDDDDDDDDDGDEEDECEDETADVNGGK